MFVFIMYSRKVQKKYIAYTKLQERSQEKHMVVWLQVGKATWLRHRSMLVDGYIVGVCKGGLKQTNLMNEEKGTFFYNVFWATRYKTTSLPAAHNQARRIDTLVAIVLI